MKRFIVDTETTGFHPGQIAQITYCVMENRKPKKIVNHFLSVESMPMQATNVHGLTKESLDRLSRGKTFRDIRGELEEDLGGALFIAYNAQFDARFVKKEFERVGTIWEPDGIFCPMAFLAKNELINGVHKNLKLADALNYLKIAKDFINQRVDALFKDVDVRAHDARYDMVALAYIMDGIEKKYGINIEELQQA